MKVLITASKNPDLDGVSCAIAYADYLNKRIDGSEYIAAFEGEPQIEAQYVLEQLRVEAKKIGDADEFDTFIIVDGSGMEGMPCVVVADKVIEAIDHRLFVDYAQFPKASWRVEPLGAAATQIAEYYYSDSSLELSGANAALLLAGIYSNTVNFKADTTSFRDERMRDWLEARLNSEQKEVTAKMFEYKTNYAFDNLEYVLRSDLKEVPGIFSEKAAFYQLEVSGAERFIENRQKMIKVCESIFPNKDLQAIIIQDCLSGNTTILTESSRVLEKLNKSSLPGEEQGDLFNLPKIFMRKSIIKALLDVN